MVQLHQSSLPLFHNRIDAGRQLAARLTAYAGCPNAVVLALPRGGLPIAHEIANTLQLPLDVCLVRKLGVPGQKELAMGAIASGHVKLLNQAMIERLGIPPAAVQQVIQQEQVELQRRTRVYRRGHPAPDLAGQTIIVVDDGIATGSTLRAAVALLKQQQPDRIVVAVPVAPADILETLRQEVDEVVCVLIPDQLNSISLWYVNFDQTTDAEVCELLDSHWDRGQGTVT
jgi:putative phosphoribosyl transferase